MSQKISSKNIFFKTIKIQGGVSRGCAQYGPDPDRRDAERWAAEAAQTQRPRLWALLGSGGHCGERSVSDTGHHEGHGHHEGGLVA